MTLLPGPAEGATAVTVVTLAMTDPADLRAVAAPAGAHVDRVLVDVAHASHRMYTDVGGPWSWVDRTGWSDTRWRTWADRPVLHHLQASVNGEVCGYAELEQQDGGEVELAYFGLLPGWSGQGLGGWLLGAALATAWMLPGTLRVWVHTCDLDGPAALPNYVARGMREIGRSVEWRRQPGGTVLP